MTIEFEVLIEIPLGSRKKYELDHAGGRIRLNRTLFLPGGPAMWLGH